jgi:hypothetical protein
MPTMSPGPYSAMSCVSGWISSAPPPTGSPASCSATWIEARVLTLASLSWVAIVLAIPWRSHGRNE